MSSATLSGQFLEILVVFVRDYHRTRIPALCAARALLLDPAHRQYSSSKCDPRLSSPHRFRTAVPRQRRRLKAVGHGYPWQTVRPLGVAPSRNMNVNAPSSHRSLQGCRVRALADPDIRIPGLSRLAPSHIAKLARENQPCRFRLIR